MTGISESQKRFSDEVAGCSIASQQLGVDVFWGDERYGRGDFQLFFLYFDPLVIGRAWAGDGGGPTLEQPRKGLCFRDTDSAIHHRPLDHLLFSLSIKVPLILGLFLCFFPLFTISIGLSLQAPLVGVKSKVIVQMVVWVHDAHPTTVIYSITARVFLNGRLPRTIFPVRAKLLRVLT